MKKTILTSILTLTCLFAVPVFAEEYTLDDEYAARLTVSEANGRLADARAIVWIVNRRAEARDITVGAYIASHHYRHVQSATRPWLAFLNRSMDVPAGWPGGEAHWNAQGKQGWRNILDTAHRVNVGEMSHGCDEAPLDWGGRVVDCVNLQARLHGDWHEVACSGGNTANMFIARGHQEPVPDLRCDEVTAALRARQAARRAAIEERLR